MEGSVDLPADTLTLTLWRDMSFDPHRDMELRVEDGVAEARTGGGPWEEIDNVTDSFAPGGDPLGFLAGSKNVTLVGEETRQVGEKTLAYTHYRFDFDGPIFAEYMRERMETLLRERGELPQGITLESSDSYRRMTGSGDLWLGAEGLPRRMTLDLVMRPESGERVEAQIKTSYSAYDLTRVRGANVGLLHDPTRWLQHRLPEAQGLRIQAGLWLAVATVALLGLLTWQTRLFQIAVSSVSLLSLILTPQLQSQQVRAFYDRQRDREAAAEVRHAEAEALERAQAALHAKDWNPNQLPVSSIKSPVSSNQLQASGTDSDGDGLSDEDENHWGTCAYAVGSTDYENSAACEGVTDPTDSDGDTFNDDVEVYQLGTLPNADDTDGDTIPDRLEITGFDYAGQRWYLNPNDPDTNGDGRLDSLECPQWSTSVVDYDETATCPDTDADGLPDLFDLDDDDDGMDDVDDASPISVPERTFDGTSPLELQIDNLETDRPVLMTLQLRPTNEDNLNYNGHVLDWPAGDTEGQIQRRLDTTFYTTQNGDAQSNAINADYGDVRVVPMLEVVMPYRAGHYANLPVLNSAPAQRAPDAPVSEWLDAAALERYGVRINDADDGSGDLLAYLPLTTISSENSGAPTAFQANMLYWPRQGTTAEPSLVDWGAAHEIRLVWLVQMLTDACVDPTADPDTCQREDTVQVIQVYQDTWELTSLTVTEEHGLDVAILYENPANDLNLDVDGELWLASWNLGNTFLRGRDCDSWVNDQCTNDGQRDVTVHNIEAQVDTWSGGTSAIDVATFNYAHSDMLPNIMLTETHTILDSVFAGYEERTYPTFLFMQENRTRTAGLGDHSTFSGSRLTLDFASVGLINMGLLSWDSYQYNRTTGRWRNFNPREYLTYLDWQLQQDAFFQAADESLEGETTAEGKRIWAQVYYLSLRQGISAWQEYNRQLMWEEDADVDEGQFAEYEYLASGAGEIAAVASNYVSSLFSGVKTKLVSVFKGQKIKYWQAVADAFNDRVARHTVDFQLAYYTLVGANNRETLGRVYSPYARSTLGVISGAVGLIATGIVTNFAADSAGGQIAADALTKTGAAILVATDTYFTIAETAKIVVEAKKLVFFSSSISAANKLISKVRVAAGIGFAVTAGLEITLFFSLYAANDLGPNDLAWWLGLSVLIATLIIESVFLVIQLALPIIGSILVLLIQIADFIASLFDASFISALAEEMAEWIYDVDTVVRNLSDRDRLDVTLLDTTLVDASAGFVQSNDLAVTVGVTNTLRFGENSSDGDARRSTFRYSLESTDADKHYGVRLNQMKEAWESLPGRYVRTTDVVSQVVNFDDVGTGINRTLDGQLYLIEAYAVPVEGCYQLGDLEYGCKYFATPDSSAINMGESLVYDILPDTIGEFVALNWSSGFPFPAQVDQDADGIARVDRGGADVDDTTVDSDGDGLHDDYEITYGLDVSAADGDLDGLNDKEELILGTNPFKFDSDADGLNDYIETVQGWLITYDDGSGGIATTRVWSDPWIADEDQDALTDLQEFVFSQHPRIETDPSVIEDVVEFNNFKLQEENGLVLLGHFEESAATEFFADSSGKGHTLSCDREAGQCPTPEDAGRFGKALVFDGVDDTLAAPFVVDPAVSGMTAATWFRVTDYGTGMTVLQQMGSGRSWLSLAGNGDLTTSLGVVRSAQPASTDDWHHAAVTYNGITVTLYLDGVSQGSTAATPPASEGTVLVGANKGFDGHFAGRLDEVAVFDRALSATEVRALMDGRTNPNDRIVTPDTALGYRATVTNTNATQRIDGLLTAESEIVEPAVIQPVAALRMEAEDYVTSLVNGTGENNTATCIGDGTCPAFNVGGQYGYGVDFDGQDDVLRLPPLQGAIFAFWIAVDALPPTGETDTLLDASGTTSGTMDVLLDSHGDLILDIAGYGPVTSTTGLTAGGGYQHILVAYGFNSVEVWKNYSRVTRHIDTALPPTLALGPGVLGNSLAQDGPFDGRLDEFVLYHDHFSDESAQYGYYRYEKIMQGVYDLTEGGQGNDYPAFLLRFEEEINIDLTRFWNAGDAGDLVCDSEMTCPTLITDGPVNEAVRFDGVDDYLPVTAVGPFGENLNISFWLQADALPPGGQRAYILNSDGTHDLDLYLDSSGHLVMDAYQSGTLRASRTSAFSFGGSNLDRPFFVEIAFEDNRHYTNGQDGYFYTLVIDGNTDIDRSDLNLVADFPDRQPAFGPGRLGLGMDGSGAFTGVLDELQVQSGYDVSFDSDLNLDVGLVNRANEGKAGSCAFTQLACPTVSANGRFGGALRFDGSDALTLDALDFAQGDYAIAAWFKSAVTGAAQTLFAATPSDNPNQLGIQLSTLSDGRLLYIHRFIPYPTVEAEIVSATPVDDGTWHHLVATRQDDAIALYVDGQLAGKAAGMDPATVGANGPLDITLAPSLAWMLGDAMTGELDELLIIPGAVDAEGVDLLMSTTYPILDVDDDFVAFGVAPQASVEVSGTAHVNADAQSSVHRFEETVEVALELQEPINLVATDDNAADLELYSPFEDVPGSTLFDNVVSNDVDGVCAGSNCPTAGLRGFLDRAVFFDGLDDQIVYTGHGGVAGYTTAVWVKADRGTILDFGDTYLDTNRLGLKVDRPYVDSEWWFHLPLEIPENIWTHVAFTFDHDTGVASTYVNGEFQDSVQTNYASGLRVDLRNPVVGRNANGLDPLHGYLDDLRLYGISLTAADIQKLYAESAPLMRFEFDEEADATTFLDISPQNYVGVPRSTTAFSPTLGVTVTTLSPTPGTDGKIGRTALFHGDGYITVAEADAIGTLTNTFTLMGWIKPDDVNALQRIFSSGRADSNGGIGFGVDAGNLIFTTYGVKNYSGSAPLQSGVWQHVAVVMDENNDADFYFNGQLVDTVPGSAPALANLDDPFYIGANHETDGTFNQFYSGELDELGFYGRAMLDMEISSIYLRELRWYRDRAAFEVTVDTDDPLITLQTTASYRPNRYQQLVVNTRDPSSYVSLLDFGVKGPNDSDFTWETAPVCQDAGGSGTAWCPAFDPSQMDGQGTYTVQFRAVDAVGNQTISPAYEFFVDDTAPQASSSYSDRPVNLTETGDLNWSIDLSGTLSDPDLVSGALPGSGVDPTGVFVALIDETGRIVGETPQPATVTGDSWSLTYQIRGYRPLGTSTVRVTAADAVGNEATHDVGTLIFDERPPQASFHHLLADSDVISDWITLSGPASDQADWGGAQLALHFEAPVPGVIPGGTSGLFMHDSSPYRREVVCLIACPTTEIPGVFGHGIEMNNDAYNEDELLTGFLFDPAETGFTAAVWFNPDPPSDSYGTLIAQQDGYEQPGSGATWLAYQDNRLASFLGGTALTSTTTVTEGQWHHGAVSYDGAMLRLYLNGQLVASAARTVVSNSDGAMVFGGSGFDTLQFLGGMDALFVYDRVLTAEEIFALAYDQGTGVQTVEMDFRPLDFDAIASGVVTSTGASNWRAVSLADGRWSYDAPAAEGYYKILLRTTDHYGNVSPEHAIWRGLIDTGTPGLSASGRHLGGGSAAQTEYTFTFSDFVLDESSIIQPCPFGALESLRYDDPALPYDEQPYEISATCRVPGHESSREFTVCDGVGHCVSQTVAPTSVPDAAAVAILTPTNRATLTGTQPISITSGAYDPDGIAEINLQVDGTPVASAMPGATVTDTTWSIGWTPSNPAVYTFTATLTDTLGNTVVDSIQVAYNPGFFLEGNLVLDGAPAPDGTDLAVLRNGRVVATTTTGAGQYGIVLAGDSPWTASVDGGRSGDSITFGVNGYELAPITTWQPGITQTLHLTHAPITYNETRDVSGNSDVIFTARDGQDSLIINANGLDLGSTQVIVKANQACTTVSQEAVDRCFQITPANSSDRNAVVTFFFYESQIPAGQSCETLNVYHWDGSTWIGPLMRDTSYGDDGRVCRAAPYASPHAIRVTGVSDFSPFVLKGDGMPTAVTLRSFAARDQRLLVLLTLLVMLGMSGIAIMALRARRNKDSSRCHRHGAKHHGN